MAVRVLWAVAVLAGLQSHQLVRGRVEEEAFVRDVDWFGGGEDLFNDGQRAIARACPYALDSSLGFVGSEAVERSIELVVGPNGRAGNKFVEVQNMLALGFCCQTPLLTLPGEDYPFLGATRQFNFSRALPPPTYSRTIAHSPICQNGGKLTQFQALMGLPKSTGRLYKCVLGIRLLGCEAKYMGPLFDVSTCPEPESPGEELTVHFRSGDIFTDGFDGGVGMRVLANPGATVGYHTYRGLGTHIHLRPPQPPLQYYELILQTLPWKRADFVTHFYDPAALGKEKVHANPAFLGLERLLDAGSPTRGMYKVEGAEFNFFTDREFEDDIRSMLCADTLSLSMSSLNQVWLWHSRARRILIPQPCSSDVWDKSFDPMSLARPGVEIWGLDWPDFDGYLNLFGPWNETAAEVMITYRDPAMRFVKCQLIAEPGQRARAGP